jgi:hypothetical protein
MSNEIRPGGTGDARVLETGANGAPADPAPGGPKGIFDHLAEYLLQQPGPDAEPSSAPVQQPEALAQPEVEQSPPHEPLPAAIGDTEMRSQELVFPETAEQLVVEKEAFVREEVVLSRLVKEHVEEIEDRVKRTEVEVQRLSPEQAQQIAQPPVAEVRPAVAEVQRAAPQVPRAAPEVENAPSPPQARPVAPTKRQADRSSSHSKTWWAWFALILLAAVLIAFAVGQFLGSAS